MRSDPEAVVSGLYAAWSLQDIEAVLAYCSNDIVYAVHQHSGVSGLGGDMTGKNAVRAYLKAVCEVWEFIDMMPGSFDVRGDEIHEYMRFHARHRPSGQELIGRKRHVWLVLDGRVARCDEYQDAASLDAFMRMVGAR